MTMFTMHKAPIPEPEDDPLPPLHPEPDEEPPPHPDPVAAPAVAPDQDRPIYRT
jgi:hypothetical protein